MTEVMNTAPDHSPLEDAGNNPLLVGLRAQMTQERYSRNIDAVRRFLPVATAALIIGEPGGSHIR